jgi:hypothetical protein
MNITHHVTTKLKTTTPSLRIELHTTQPEQLTTTATTTTTTATTTSSSTTSSPSSVFLPSHVQLPYTSGDHTAYQQISVPTILPVQDQPSRNVISSAQLQSNKMTTERKSIHILNTNNEFIIAYIIFALLSF